jgi:hypothetical protein
MSYPIPSKVCLTALSAPSEDIGKDFEETNSGLYLVMFGRLTGANAHAARLRDTTNVKRRRAIVTAPCGPFAISGNPNGGMRLDRDSNVIVRGSMCSKVLLKI